MRCALTPSLAALFFVPLLNGCATHRGVVPLDENRFVLVGNEIASYPGRFNFRNELVNEASQHCAKTGRLLNIVRATEMPERNVIVNYRWARIEFECVPKNTRPPASRPRNA